MVQGLSHYQHPQPEDGNKNKVNKWNLIKLKFLHSKGNCQQGEDNPQNGKK